MTALLMIRHGKTSWNAQKKLQGRQDIPLSKEGTNLLLKKKIPGQFDDFHWVSSPLQRARQTAELLGGDLITVKEALIEMDWGDWEGRTIAELRSEYAEEMSREEDKGLHMTPPNGESPYRVQQRLKPWLKSLGNPTIAVAHKGIIRAMKSLAYDWDMKDKSPVTFDWNCAHLFDVEEDGKLTVIRPNIPLEKK